MELRQIYDEVGYKRMWVLQNMTMGEHTNEGTAQTSVKLRFSYHNAYHIKWVNKSRVLLDQDVATAAQCGQ